MIEKNISTLDESIISRSPCSYQIVPSIIYPILIVDYVQVGCGGEQAEHQGRGVHLDPGQGGDIGGFMATSLQQIVYSADFQNDKALQQQCRLVPQCSIIILFA